jgi:hypothetical protein
MKRKPSSTKKFGRPGNNPAAQRIMNRIEKSESLHRARKTVREHDEDPPSDAEAAGAQYAQEQLESNYFMDWVREQLREASRMDPDKVLPLETQQDAMEIAKNMLQQLRWDTQRDLDGRQIARLIGVDSTSHEDVKEFFKGFRETLSMNREWLAGELLEIKGEMGARMNEARRTGGTRGGPARKYFVIDQVQNGQWEQVGHFSTRAAAEKFRERLEGRTRIGHGFPKGHEPAPIFKRGHAVRETHPKARRSARPRRR